MYMYLPMFIGTHAARTGSQSLPTGHKMAAQGLNISEQQNTGKLLIFTHNLDSLYVGCLKFDILQNKHVLLFPYQYTLTALLRLRVADLSLRTLGDRAEVFHASHSVGEQDGQLWRTLAAVDTHGGTNGTIAGWRTAAHHLVARTYYNRNQRVNC